MNGDKGVDKNRLTPIMILRGREVRDGAGVRISRLFGSPDTFDFTDPFLLLDYFGSDKPEEYEMGFPWHPHRGIETLTYLLKGRVEHEDSIGNRGVIHPGEIQWMTAGSGIFHQEMPKSYGQDRDMLGFQLWLNLRKGDKMSKPTYRGIDVNHLNKLQSERNEIKVISGSIMGRDNPLMEKHSLDVSYFDVTSDGGYLEIPKGDGFTSLVIPMEGSLLANGTPVNKLEVAVFGSGRGDIRIEGSRKHRYIYISGRRTNDKISWYGPIVMNDWKEIEDSFRDLQKGTFVRDMSPNFNAF
ncbi:MAG: pirin family protein [Candidatus Thermoplasmatota archaeon]|jgi:redox-sensitive bicupin YhaK (pirin superfamily)|nr:pirin family protein [Candidatus Thermoplasmatota archaeon]MCL5789937.1 pirin family protein [Candidatus Thermoplasmatota archaeon]